MFTFAMLVSMRTIVATFLVSTILAGAQTYISIAQFRQRPFGDSIRAGERIAARVTVANQFRNTCYIQDGTGGIAVFNSTFRMGVAVGDSVELLSGTLTEFGQTTGQPGTGLAEIAGSVTYQVIPVPRQEPAPRTASITAIGEALEGMLVRVRNVQFVETGVFQGDRNYTVRNSAGDQLQVRIDANTEIARNSLPIPTQRVDVIGVISQFRGTYQLLPRFASDIGLTIEQDTVPKDATLDVTTWNLLWFGSTDTTIGVSNKQRQFNSIRLALDSMRSDIYAFQEVVTARVLDSLASTVQGSYAGYLAPIEQQQKMAYLVNRDAVTVIESGLAVNGGPQAWASGRFPFRLTARCRIGNIERTILLFNIHAKATGDSTTAQDDWLRRKTDAETFHDYLNTFYPNDAVIILGDFNDDVTSSVVSPNQTPYAVFIEDSTNWRVLTKSLSELGLKSYIGSTLNARMLDHIIISNELFGAIHRTYLEAPNAFLSSYTTTVSDHLPVTVRIRLADVIASVSDEQQGTSLRVGPNPASDRAFIEIEVPHSMPLRIELVDLQGRDQITLVDEIASPGIRLVPIDCSRVASGMYSIRVVRDTNSTAIPFVVIH
jgi:endonuclease/exonuclease/phosphatase family metal-dependent hydrolase